MKGVGACLIGPIEGCNDAGELSVIIVGEGNIVGDAKWYFAIKFHIITTYNIEYSLGQLKDSYIHCL